LSKNDTIEEEEEAPRPRPFYAFFFGDSILNQKEELLNNWFLKEKDRAVYTYDFGDDWEHNIVLERIFKHSEVHYPLCIKAKNDTPPEDSRYEVMTGAIDLANPDGKEIVDDVNYVLQTDDLKKFLF